MGNTKIPIILLKFIPKFIEKMGGNVIKHLDRLVKLLSYPVHGYGTLVNRKRTETLKILAAIVKSCWPVIPTYSNIILKLAFRMLIDVCSCVSLSDGRVSTATIEEGVFEVVCLLLECCGQSVGDELKKLLSLSMDQQFDPIKHVVQKALEKMKDENIAGS